MIILFLSILSINLISAVTLNSGTITSTGLNSTINITFSLTFDVLNVSNDSITFHNLSYVHPSSCNGQSSFYSVYNYTNSSENTTLDQILPSNSSCAAGATSTTSPSSSGGGNTISSVSTSQQYIWALTLTPENVSVLNFSNSSIADPILALNEMDISANGTKSANVIVTRYYAPPQGIPNLSSTQIYQYLQISFNDQQVLSVLKNVNLIFKVNKSWISGNKINPNNVSVYKSDNATNNQWIMLPTTYNSSDANFYYYQTSVNSFSYFAIGAIGNTQQNQGPSPQPLLNKNKNSTLFLLIIIVIILIIGALVLLIIKKKKKEYKFGYPLLRG